MHFVAKFNKYLNMKNPFVCIITSENNKQYLVSYFCKHVAFIRVFFIKELGTNTLFIHIENVARLVYLLFYCDSQKFNLTSGFLIFLSMVTSREIFICSTDNRLLYCLFYSKLKTLKMYSVTISVMTFTIMQQNSSLSKSLLSQLTYLAQRKACFFVLI